MTVDMMMQLLMMLMDGDDHVYDIDYDVAVSHLFGQ